MRRVMSLLVCVWLGCSGGTERSGPGQAAEWWYWGGDPGGMRYSTLDQITRENVAQLQPAFRVRNRGNLGEPLRSQAPFDRRRLAVFVHDGHSQTRCLRRRREDFHGRTGFEFREIPDRLAPRFREPREGDAEATDGPPFPAAGMQTQHGADANTGDSPSVEPENSVDP